MPNSLTLAAVLKERSNDYSNLERRFKFKTGLELVTRENAPLRNYNRKVSIIIPTYNSWETLELTLLSLEKQELHSDQKRLIEVIVADDGSTDGTGKEIAKRNYPLNLKYIRSKHLGVIPARNRAAAEALRDIVISLDSDILLEEHFLNEHLLRHHYLKDIVLVSFLENILPNDKRLEPYREGKVTLKPDINRDFRIIKTVKDSWLKVNQHVSNVDIRTVKILEETDNFKNFGFGKSLGVWDLPAMVLTGAVSMKRADLEKAGYFNPKFNEGWAMYDTFLGACLIAIGKFVVPCCSTGAYHLDRPRTKEIAGKRLAALDRNVLVYLDLVDRPLGKILGKGAITQIKKGRRV